MMPPRLLAFGSNGSGQLGVGHREDIAAPEECQFVAADHDHDSGNDNGDDVWLSGETIRDIAAGGNHTLVLTSAGRVFTAGDNGLGKCGLGDGASEGGSSRFRAIPGVGEDDASALGRATHIAATWEASFFVIDGRKVYGCGAGAKGELGFGDGVTTALTPMLILDMETMCGNGSKVARLTASMGHVVLMTDSGSLFGWGACRKGQLGEALKNEKTTWTPRPIDLQSPVHSVVVGRDFTYMIDGQGKGHVLGDDKYSGEFGTLSVDYGDLIFAGWSNIFSWNRDKLAGAGRNNRGQLPPPQLTSPKLFAAGSEHSIAVTPDGQVVAWGWGEHGNCGKAVDDRGNVAGRLNEIPLRLKETESVSLVAAGCATSFVVVSGHG